MNTCKYCNKSFTRPSTFQTHVCEQKRRHAARTEKHSMIALQAFIRFHELNSASHNKKTFDDFVKSPYYNAFIKFGSFINNTKPLYPSKFIDWMVKSNEKIDHWCREALYEKYVISLIYSESVNTALERTIVHMQLWAEKNKSEWTNYFKDVNANVAFFDIKDGKVSPWLLLNCDSGILMLGRLNDEQLNKVAMMLDTKKWGNIFKQQKQDLAFVDQVIKAGKL
jgi:hypothetical protein